MRRLIAAILGVLAIASTASAHVTVKNPDTREGARATFTVGVPNERPDSATVAVSLRIPAGFTQVRPVARDGWRNLSQRQRGTTVLTWRGGRITGSANAVFRFTAIAPATAGAYRIPSVQTYEDGEVVRWIGPAGAEFEAPVITIGRRGAPVAPAAGRHTLTTAGGTDTTATTTTDPGTTSGTATTEPTTTATPATTTGGDEGSGAIPIYPLFIVFGIIAVAVVVGTIAYRRQHRAVREEAAAADEDRSPDE